MTSKLKKLWLVLKNLSDLFQKHCPSKLKDYTVLWQLYIENRKHVPNFLMYDAFLLEKQLIIWRIVQNRCPFLKSSLSKIVSVKTYKIRYRTALWKTNFLKYTTFLLGPKRFVNSKGPKIALCLCKAWLSLCIERQMCNVQYRFCLFCKPLYL